MKAVLESREGNKVSFNFEVEANKFEEALQKVYLKNRGSFNIPGFRKGKVPRKIIETTYGEEIFYEDAINLILPQVYSEAIDELKIDPVDTPNVDIEEIKKGEPIRVNIEVDVKPEIKLGDYDNMEVEKVELEMTDEVLENELKAVQEQNARLIDGSDKEIENGDIAKIDFEGFLDGEAFEGGKAEDHDLEIGSNTFIPGFEEQLLGKKKGEEVEVNVTFPEEYHQETLAGKEVVFKVLVKEIKTKEVPELDDEFVKDISEFDTLEEYKADLRAKLEEEINNQAKIEKENKLLEKLVEESEMDIPKGMIESQIDEEIKQFDYRLRSQGLELEKYLELTGSDMAGLREQLKDIASNKVKVNLVLEAVIEKENIEVEESEIDVELRKMGEQYRSEDIDGFVEDMKKGSVEFLKTGIANEKAVKLLLEKVKFI